MLAEPHNANDSNKSTRESMNPRPEREIPLAAYDGTEIPNYIDADPSPGYIQLAYEGIRIQMLGTRRVGPPTGRYNCHGLVFANRRTNVRPKNLLDLFTVDNLLQQDEYERVDTPQIGDVIVYRSVTGAVQHTGIVVSSRPISAESVVLQPLVWSKWGSLDEFEHPIPVSPYQDCEHEFWRLKSLR